MPRLPDSGFDNVASFYDWLARLVFGTNLLRAQLALLPHVPERAKVLLIGGGSGWLLTQLLATQKHLDILYLEASPEMLKKAQKKHKNYLHSHHATITFRLGTEQALKPQEQFDIVITPFLLDLFPEQRLHQLMQRLYTSLLPGGLWLFADFWPVQQKPPLWQRGLLKSMYLFFGTLSGVQARRLPDFKQHFDKLNMKEKYSYTFFEGMVQTKVFGK